MPECRTNRIIKYVRGFNNNLVRGRCVCDVSLKGSWIVFNLRHYPSLRLSTVLTRALGFCVGVAFSYMGVIPFR